MIIYFGPTPTTVFDTLKLSGLRRSEVNGVTKVELYELIRREHFEHGKSIRGISRNRGIHRRMVRQAVLSSIPPPRKVFSRPTPVLTAGIRGVIDGWLSADRSAPRKQRHTARRIYHRLRNELGFGGSEVTVRRYVRLRRRELGFSGAAFVPQAYAPGEQGEVDWYEAYVDFPAGRELVQFFVMRSCYSADEFHRGFSNQTQQAFLEGHVEGVSYFGGVFHGLRYDNLTVAVKKILKGRRREETDRFVALRSHYLFASSFCLPGLEGAHEKGGVENTVGRFRRSHLVPVPAFRDYDELNRYLLARCREDHERRLPGRVKTVGEMRAEEAGLLLPLPDQPFPTAEVGDGGVDSKGLVPVKTNRYSVPIRFAGRSVEVRVHAGRVQFVHGGKVVAAHARLTGRFGIRVTLDHYLELLKIKPGAFKGSLALFQARQSGAWPPLYDRLWEELKERFGESEGTRQLVEVLMLNRYADPEAVAQAIAEAFACGCYDAGAIAVLLRRRVSGQEVITPPLSDLGRLRIYDRPAGDVRHYDALLAQPGVS